MHATLLLTSLLTVALQLAEHQSSVRLHQHQLSCCTLFDLKWHPGTGRRMGRPVTIQCE